MHTYCGIRKIALLATVVLPMAFATSAASAQDKPKEHGDSPASSYEPSMTTLGQINVEIPGRKLELVSQHERGHEFVLTEAGKEQARFQHRKSSQQQDWLADYHAQEESVPLAAFVVWLILESRRYMSRR